MWRWSGTSVGGIIKLTDVSGPGLKGARGGYQITAQDGLSGIERHLVPCQMAAVVLISSVCVSVRVCVHKSLCVALYYVLSL